MIGYVFIIRRWSSSVPTTKHNGRVIWWCLVRGRRIGRVWCSNTNQLAFRKTAQVSLALACSLNLYRVISGYMGWVRSVCMEPGNEWFDKVIWHYNGHLSAVYDCSL